MVLTDDDVLTIARLARIAVEPGRIADYRRDLGTILDLFARLREVDTSGVEPMAHPLDLEQRLRADEVTEEDARAEYLALAPSASGGLYLVPKVIE